MLGFQTQSLVESCASRLQSPASRRCCSFRSSRGRPVRQMRTTERLLSWQCCRCWTAASRCSSSLSPMNGSVANVHCPGLLLILLRLQMCNMLLLLLVRLTSLFFTSLHYSALTLLVGWQEGHPACKEVECLFKCLLVVMISLELCTYYTSGCHHHFHHP